MSKLPAGVVNIRGKEYTTVALRVHQFREKHPGLSLVTEIIHRDVDCVVMKASVLDGHKVLATGHAEEYRKTSEINKTSAVENCETSAIGRALAAFGLGGTEFASADEVAHAISGGKGEPRGPGVIKATDGAEKFVNEQRGLELRELVYDIVNLYNSGKEMEAIKGYYTLSDNDEKVYVWQQLASESKLRALIKANKQEAA